MEKKGEIYFILSGDDSGDLLWARAWNAYATRMHYESHSQCISIALPILPGNSSGRAKDNTIFDP